MTTVDATNACIPETSPIFVQHPSLPSATRGEPCPLDGHYNARTNESILVYASGKQVVCVTMNNDNESTTVFVYRGHTARVTALQMSSSGAYVASGDVRGKLRVWAFDHPEHLCKLEQQSLSGPIRDISWDVDNRRIAIVGERTGSGGGGDSSALSCGKVIQWDTGVSCGELGPHARGRASSVAFKPNRPMRIVSGGLDDAGKLQFYSGPPFVRMIVSTTENDDKLILSGPVHCVRYNTTGTYFCNIASGSTPDDKGVVVYDGKTMMPVCSQSHVHAGTIYSCDWDSRGNQIVTCSADGTAKLLKFIAPSSDGGSAASLEVVHSWDIATWLSSQRGISSSNGEKVPVGGMQVGCTFLKGKDPENDVAVVVGICGDVLFLNNKDSEKGIKIQYTGHIAPIAGLAIDAQRNLLYTADTDGKVCQHDLTYPHFAPKRRFAKVGDTTLMDRLHGDASISCLACLSETGVVLTCGWDDTIRMATHEGTILEENKIALKQQPSAIHCGTNLCAVVTVGSSLVLLSKSGDIPAKTVATMPLDYSAHCVCVSQDDSKVYVGGQDCNIYIYSVSADATSLTLEHKIENAHLQPIHAISLSHDGTKLATGDVRDVCVWDVSSLPSVKSIVGKSRWCFHMQRITCLCWSMDDSVVASGGADDSIYLWSVAKKMKRLHYPFSHRGGISGLQFLPPSADDKNNSWILVSVGSDACVNYWNVSNDVAKKFG